MSARRICTALVLFATLALSGDGAIAATGTALGVKTDASVVAGAVTRTLMVGYDLNIGDKVVTDSSGLVQILFEDKTELVVGPNSALVLEDYLLRADGSAGKFAIDALSGTFRFATGLAPKDSYEINTPTGTIGVRGTAFDFHADEMSTNVLVYHGAVIICSLADECEVLSRRCEIGRYDNRESNVLGIGTSSDIDERFFREAFRYAFSQQALLREFRVSNADNCARTVVAQARANPPARDVDPPPPPPGAPEQPEEPKPPKTKCTSGHSASSSSSCGQHHPFKVGGPPFGKND